MKALKARWRAAFWPTVVDVGTARTAAKHGMQCAWFVAAITGLLSALAMAGVWNIVNPAALLDALIFTVVGFGIRRMSRVAALVGLALFVTERVDWALSHSSQGNVVMTLVLVLGFIAGVRGTLGFHRFATEEERRAVMLGPGARRRIAIAFAIAFSVGGIAAALTAMLLVFVGYDTWAEARAAMLFRGGGDSVALWMLIAVAGTGICAARYFWRGRAQNDAPASKQGLVRYALTCLRCGAHITTTESVSKEAIAAVERHLRAAHPDWLPAGTHKDFAELLGQVRVVRVKMADWPQKPKL